MKIQTTRDGILMFLKHSSLYIHPNEQIMKEGKGIVVRFLNLPSLPVTIIPGFENMMKNQSIVKYETFRDCPSLTNPHYEKALAQFRVFVNIAAVRVCVFPFLGVAIFSHAFQFLGWSFCNFLKCIIFCVFPFSCISKM